MRPDVQSHRNFLALLGVLLAAAFREGRGRTVLSIFGIALGIALGLAITLINESAVGEMTGATQRLSGEADLRILAPGRGFDENLYPRVAQIPGVEVAVPAVDLVATLPGQADALRILGLDILAGQEIQPALATGELPFSLADLLNPDTIALSPEAAQWLKVKVGDTLDLAVGDQRLRLDVIGLLPPGAYRQRMGVMDIANAQWRLGKPGFINRLDVRLQPGTESRRIIRHIEGLLPAGVEVSPVQAADRQARAASRAYRVNLQVLGGVALFTGVFLVYATQSLAILRRRTSLAMLRILGFTRKQLLASLIVEGACIGAVGSLLGMGLGILLASLTLNQLGGELGAGFFENLRPRLRVSPWQLAAFFLAGCAASILGMLGSAWQAARLPPAQGIKAQGMPPGGTSGRHTTAGIILWVVGLLALAGPPVQGLPVFGYVGIAGLTLGTVLLMPVLIQTVTRRLPDPQHPVGSLLLSRLKRQAPQATTSISAVLVSFSLMVAMSVMVLSFRVSFTDWLERLLQADVYVRAAAAGETAYFNPTAQRQIAMTPGIARVEWRHTVPVQMVPGMPRATLLVREINPGTASRLLPMQHAVDLPSGALPAAWISEPLADLYDLTPGDTVKVPLGGRARSFAVAGVWRDYGRQFGAIVIDRQSYIALTGDQSANEVALWLHPGVEPGDVAGLLRSRLPAMRSLVINFPGEIRARSLEIFDRSFAVTYLLEAVAIVIGLFGVANSFSAQSIARRAEMGMLRHLGYTRGQLGWMVSLEGAVVSLVGVGAGLLLGLANSLILIYVINRQSFHWSMDLHLPVTLLALMAAVLVLAATGAARWGGRHVLKQDVVRAVREDW